MKVNGLENDAIPPPEPLLARLLKKASLRRMTKRDVNTEPLFERVFDAIFNLISIPAEHTISTLLPFVGKEMFSPNVIN